MTVSASAPTRRDRPLRIITRHYTPEAVGSGPVMRELAVWFAGQGCPVEVLTARPSYPTTQIFSDYRSGRFDRTVEDGVVVLRLPSRAASKGLWRRALPEAGFFLRLLAKKCQIPRPCEGDLISLCPSILTVTAAWFWRPRNGHHLAIVHDIQSGLGAALGGNGKRQLLRLLRWIEKTSFNRVDGVVVLSASMRDQLHDLGVTVPIIILPPSIDTDIIAPRIRPADAPPTLLYSGTFGRKQGLHQLLDLAAILQIRRPSVRMILRGDGPLKAELMKRAACDGLDQISFQPFVPPSNIAEGMAEGDIHLIPQLAGGADYAVPSKTYAIMAAGRPFVATAAPLSPLALLADASGGGLCAAPGSIEEFAECIIELLDDEKRQKMMGEAGRRYAVDFSDTDVVMKILRRFIDNPAFTDEALPISPGHPKNVERAVIIDVARQHEEMVG